MPITAVCRCAVQRRHSRAQHETCLFAHIPTPLPFTGMKSRADVSPTAPSTGAAPGHMQHLRPLLLPTSAGVSKRTSRIGCTPLQSLFASHLAAPAMPRLANAVAAAVHPMWGRHQQAMQGSSSTMPACGVQQFPVVRCASMGCRRFASRLMGGCLRQLSSAAPPAPAAACLYHALPARSMNAAAKQPQGR